MTDELPSCDVCGCCETPGQCVWSAGCPKCGAEPREQCRRASGIGVEGLHAERHDAAARARGESPDIVAVKVVGLVDFPTVAVNRRTDKYDVYVGRPSKWGNPFSHVEGQGETLVASRAEAVEAYRQWLWTQPDLLDALGELEGKRLGCWCKPLECHADVLVRAVEWWRTQQGS